MLHTLPVVSASEYFFLSGWCWWWSPSRHQMSRNMVSFGRQRPALDVLRVFIIWAVFFLFFVSLALYVTMCGGPWSRFLRVSGSKVGGRQKVMGCFLGFFFIAY
ncbi:hypothetical protein F4809DRAFT_623124, partial [Biscogniauxia mediterranea]